MYLTIEDMAALVKLSIQTIRRYVLNREIPYYKLKKAIRFSPSEIERWVKKSREETAADGDGDLFAETEAKETGADGETEEAHVWRT
jgi:excisionase family DNA binding protein